eukprot:2380273-Amphidinium_carterae.1
MMPKSSAKAIAGSNIGYHAPWHSVKWLDARDKPDTLGTLSTPALQCRIPKKNPYGRTARLSTYYMLRTSGFLNSMVSHRLVLGRVSLEASASDQNQHLPHQMSGANRHRSSS